MDDIEYVIGPDGELLYLRDFVETLARLVQEQIERERRRMESETLTPPKAAAATEQEGE